MKTTGQVVVGLIRQSGDSVSQNEDGSWDAEVKFVGQWPAVAYYAPQRNSSPHPDFPALICKSCQITRLKPGNFAEIVARYRGFITTAPGDGGGIGNSTEEIVVGTSDAPIETHPKFGSDLGGSKASPKNDAIFDDKGKFLGFAATSTYAGIDSYLYPSLTYRTTTPFGSRPDGLAGVGQIATPPVSAPTDTNWLFTARTWRRDGGVYEVSEEYLLSPPGGWDPVIYGP